MKRIALLTLLAIPLLTQAADQKLLRVTATIADSCIFRQVPAVLGFGSIDPIGVAAVQQGTTVRYTCTKGATASVKVGANATGSIQRNLGKLDGSGENIPYTVSWTPPTGAGTGHGPGQEIDLALDARIDPAAFQNASGGDYADDTLFIDIDP